MQLRTPALVIAALCLCSSAHAAPVEVLEALDIAPGEPGTLVLRYRWGNGGFFLSKDGGKSFSFLCNGVIDSSVRREASGSIVRSDGTLVVGVFDGLWTGAADGCSWSGNETFAGRWVNDFVYDPHDHDRIYAITSSGGQENGIYVNTVGSDDWKPVGTQEEILINRLHVAKLGEDGLRFYQSIVRGEHVVMNADGGIDERSPRYFVRHSDDMGKTWTEHEYGKTDGAVRLLAVDPSDPDRIVLGVLRDELSAGAAIDELFVSTERGEQDSFVKFGEVGELGGTSFSPDGRLFYGDRHQDSPALFTLPAGGDKSEMLSSDYKVGCVRYDAMTDRLYVCQDTLFGTADPKTGAFTEIYDIKQADTFAACEPEGSVAATCKAVMLANFCNFTHYFCAPMCLDFEVQDLDGKPARESAYCLPDAGPRPTGDAGVGVMRDAGATADSGSVVDEDDDDGGCSVTRPRGAGLEHAPWLALGLAALFWLRSRRRRLQ